MRFPLEFVMACVAAVGFVALGKFFAGLIQLLPLLEGVQDQLHPRVHRGRTNDPCRPDLGCLNRNRARGGHRGSPVKGS